MNLFFRRILELHTTELTGQAPSALPGLQGGIRVHAHAVTLQRTYRGKRFLAFITFVGFGELGVAVGLVGCHVGGEGLL